ncbi:MAG: DUF427 domain-containing protein [Cyanobacteria bacterium P01_F01_bin.42]
MKPRPTPITPQPGQESVWDYPRPAVLADTDKHLKVVCGSVVLADTRRGKRVLETSHPPTYYFPAEDVKIEALLRQPRTSFCEWKGWSTYYDISIAGKVISCGAWRFYEPSPNFTVLQDYYGFYAKAMDACYVDDEQVTPQSGDFYGGWITSNVVGPFKGYPGTRWW